MKSGAGKQVSWPGRIGVKCGGPGGRAQDSDSSLSDYWVPLVRECVNDGQGEGPESPATRGQLGRGGDAAGGSLEIQRAAYGGQGASLLGRILLWAGRSGSAQASPGPSLAPPRHDPGRRGGASGRGRGALARRLSSAGHSDFAYLQVHTEALYIW